MGEPIIELRMDLILSFQERLLESFEDPDFRKTYIEPALYSGEEENYIKLINEILKNKEIINITQSILESGECSEESIKMELLILLKKMIQRISDFEDERGFDSDYIG